MKKQSAHEFWLNLMECTVLKGFSKISSLQYSRQLLKIAVFSLYHAVLLTSVMHFSFTLQITVGDKLLSCMPASVPNKEAHLVYICSTQIQIKCLFQN